MPLPDGKCQSVCVQGLLVFKGTNGVRDDCSLPPMAAEQLLTFIRGEKSPENLSKLRHRYQQKTPDLGIKGRLRFQVSRPDRLGIIFAHDADKEARKITREVHPEILFWALNGMKAMLNKKGKLIGYEERKAVLSRVLDAAGDIAEQAVACYRRSDVARDDILDALAAAATGYLSKGELITIPDDVPTDTVGLSMEMVYFLP